MNETPAKFLRDQLIKLFRALDTPEAERDPYLEPEIAAFQQGQGELDLGISVKVSIAQFHGIEINDFAVAVAKTALSYQL